MVLALTAGGVKLTGLDRNSLIFRSKTTDNQPILQKDA
jgi:hypothetical protein